jgi:hypothetical protein
VNVTEPPVSETVAVNVGVESFVMRSERLEPVSLAATRVGAAGAEGAYESKVTVVLFDVADTLPALSV